MSQQELQLALDTGEYTIKTVYQVYSFNDDRGGSKREEQCCLTAELAKLLSYKNSYYGADGSYKPKLALVYKTTYGREKVVNIETEHRLLVTSAANDKEIKTEILKAKALAKLSKDERAALGF